MVCFRVSMSTESRRIVKVACEKCGAKYSLPEARLVGHVLKIRCKTCRAVFEVRDDKPNSVEGRGKKIWFVVIARERVGPLTGQQVRDRIAVGELHARSHIWRQGMDRWERLASVDEFAEIFLENVTLPSMMPPSGMQVGKPTNTMRLTRLGTLAAETVKGGRGVSMSTDMGAVPAERPAFKPEPTRVVSYAGKTQGLEDQVKAAFFDSSDGLSSPSTAEYPDTISPRDLMLRTDFDRALASLTEEEDDDDAQTRRTSAEDARRMREAIDAGSTSHSIESSCDDLVSQRSETTQKTLAHAGRSGTFDEPAADADLALREGEGPSTDFDGSDLSEEDHEDPHSRPTPRRTDISEPSVATAIDATSGVRAAEAEAEAAKRGAQAEGVGAEVAQAEADEDGDGPPLDIESSLDPENRSPTYQALASLDQLAAKTGDHPAVSVEPAGADDEPDEMLVEKKGPLAGQRGEDSVLFSLKGLAQAEAARVAGKHERVEPPNAKAAPDDVGLEELPLKTRSSKPSIPVSAVLVESDTPRKGWGFGRFLMGMLIGALLLGGGLYAVRPDVVESLIFGASGDATNAGDTSDSKKGTKLASANGANEKNADRKDPAQDESDAGSVATVSDGGSAKTDAKPTPDVGPDKPAKWSPKVTPRKRRKIKKVSRRRPLTGKPRIRKPTKPKRAGGKPKPAGDMRRPAGVKVKPGDKATPAGDKATPAGDKAKPAGDKAKPAGDKAKPAGDKVTLAGDKATPAGDKATPAGDKATPAGDKPKPADKAKPAGDKPATRLTPAQLRAGIAPSMAAIKKCARDSTPDLVTVQLVIHGRTGKLKSSRVLGSFTDAAFSACVSRALERARFAKTQTAKATYRTPIRVR
jgi:hypothetical protein